MAAELMLVNPRHKRRRRRAGVKRRRRSRSRVGIFARNPRHRRRMSALQRRFFGGKRRRRSSRALTVMSSNPRRRRRRGFAVFRRNPSPLSNPVGYTEDMAVPAIAGAVGGIAIDYLFNNISSLANLSPMVGDFARLGIAALLGYGVGMATNKKTGALVAGGAMTITVYQMVSNYLSTSGVSTGYYGMNGVGRYVRMNGVGRYARMGRMKGYLPGNRGMRGMGWVSPASVGGMGRFVPA